MHLIKEVAGGGFSHFKTGNFSLQNTPRERGPNWLDSKDLGSAVKANNVTTIREHSKKFKVSNAVVLCEFKRIEKTLSLENGSHINCQLLWVIAYMTNSSALFVSWDEKWILYHNFKCHRLWISWGNRPTQQLRGEINPKIIEYMVGYSMNHTLWMIKQ